MNLRAKPAIRLLLICLGALVSLRAHGQLANPGFETGSPGQAPPGWFVPPIVTQGGYVVQISADSPKEGKQCLAVSLAGGQGQGIGNVFQTFSALPFRGKYVRFRAAVRYATQGQAGQAQLWLRVDRPNGVVGLFDNMGRRPIRSSTWAFYEIVGKVDADAETINVGMFLAGGGTAYLDAASFGVADIVEEPVEKSRPLTERGLQNLVAFAKLYGYVRFFHPSDAVAAADWNAYAMAGVKATEDAADSAELAKRLNDFFHPIAPTVQVYTDDAKPSVPPLPDPKEATEVVTWEHIGFGGGTIPAEQNIYRSRRVFVAKSTGAPKTGDVDPTKVFTASLGAGVSCEVPLALYAANDSALPHTADPAPPKGVRREPTGDDRNTRLADVVIAWNVYQHFYPYFDVVKADWPAVLTASLNEAAADADAQAFLKTLRRLVAAAKDGHGNVFIPSNDGGAQPPILADWVEGKYVVLATGPEVTRPHPGDEILKIDGAPVDELWRQIEPTISGATEQWRRFRGRTELLDGPAGSSVEIVARNGSGAPFTVSLTRGSVFVKEKRPKPIQELKVGIWYVDLDGGRANMDDYKKAIHDLSTADGIIFDMRGYPNDVAMDVLPRIAKEPLTSAWWNVPKVTLPDGKGVEFLKSRWPPRPPDVPRFKGKIAFITDGEVISYAESVMGIVENYKLGAIVGEPTAGTNGNVNPFALPGGYTVVFTGMKVLKHDGSVHHGVGIQPTVPAHRTIAGVAAGRDELLEKALEIVRG